MNSFQQRFQGKTSTISKDGTISIMNSYEPVQKSNIGL